MKPACSGKLRACRFLPAALVATIVAASAAMATLAGGVSSASSPVALSVRGRAAGAAANPLDAREYRDECESEALALFTTMPPKLILIIR